MLVAMICCRLDNDDVRSAGYVTNFVTTMHAALCASLMFDLIITQFPPVCCDAVPTMSTHPPLPSNRALIQPHTARPRFTSRLVHVGFVVDEMTLGGASLSAVRFQTATGPSVRRHTALIRHRRCSGQLTALLDDALKEILTLQV